MEKPCFLCKSKENDELLYGKVYSKNDISVHYYCLLLSSNLVQNGVNDEIGILGFLPADIRKENERTKSCRCYICKQMHANVFCCAKKCLRTFHTVCGVKNRCLSHFTGTFQSWCAVHVPLKQENWQHLAEEQCSICYEEMGCYDRITSIRAPCCKNGWFHQQCVARFAQTAGYFFKCPLCNNVDTFTQEMPLRGVFVPERDAAWELEPNAFQEQLVRPSTCDAEECKCTEGRETDNRKWELLMCGTCGSTCRHRDCMESAESRTYVCSFCRPIVGAAVPELAVDGDDDDEEDDDDGDADDNDDEATSSMSSEDSKRVNWKDPPPGSEESGVQCSSSDESILKPHRPQRSRIRIHSEASDSEQSGTSSPIMRRSLIRNTGKRVRRVIVEESEETDGKEDDLAGTTIDGVGEKPSDTPNRPSVDVQMDENSNTSGTSSISLERAHTILRTGAKRRWIDSSDEAEKGTKKRRKVRSSSVRTKKPKKSSQSPTLTDNPSTSTDDDKCTKGTKRPKRSRATLRSQKWRQSSASPTKIGNPKSSDTDKDANCTNQLRRNRSAIRRAKSSQSSRNPTASSFTEAECTESAKKKHVRETSFAKMASDDSDSTDDIPLSKHRFIEAKRCAKEEKQQSVDALDRSNEENIRPLHSQKNKPAANQLTPPSAASGATGGVRDRRLQQSIVKFFTSSPRYTPPKTTSNHTDQAASSSSSPSTNERTQDQKNAIKSTAGADASEGSKRTRKAAARQRQKMIVPKQKRQINLFNYFSRC